MTVQCPTCHATLTVPDDRVPRGKVLQAACPRCKGPITIEGASVASTMSAPQGPEPEVTGKPSAPRSYDEQRQPRALACVEAEDERALAVAGLKEAGYSVEALADPGEALERLRFTPHAVAVIRRSGTAGPSAGLLNAVAEMTTGARRHLCIVLVSDDLPALDPAAAFAHSVDAIVHPRDLAHLADIVKHCTADRERRYHVLLESLRAMGKG